MKVTGTQTTRKTVDVEISELEIKRIVSEQSVEFLAKVIEEKMKEAFIESLEPKFAGSRTVRPSSKSDSRGILALVHVDAFWNHHNNVGEDEEVRLLTTEEENRYMVIWNFAKNIIKELQK